MNKVLVIGQLGELIKKIIELEVALAENPNQNIAMVTLVAYHRVLSAWPVVDDITFHVQDFRLALTKLIQSEKDFKASALTDNPFRLHMDAVEYIRTKEIVQEKLKRLNSLGRFTGSVPILEVDLNQLGETSEQDIQPS